MKKAIKKVIEGFGEIQAKGGYREKEELLKTVRAFGWFKNFDMELCRALENLEAVLEDEVE